MLLINGVFDTLVITFFYMFVYNLSLVLLFWTLFQFSSFKLNTINSLSDLKSNNFFLMTITFVFFSISGIPPFLGFFAKLLILVNLLNTNFYFFFIFFFVLLFFGLYFYLQNLRFLYSTTKSKINFFFFNNQLTSHLSIFNILIYLFILSFSFVLVEDIYIFIQWLLN